jgi:hypothetical protein
MVLAGEARNGREAVQVFRALRPAGRPGAQPSLASLDVVERKRAVEVIAAAGTDEQVMCLTGGTRV